MCDNRNVDFDAKKRVLTEKYVMVMKLHRMYLDRELNHSGVYRSQNQILMHIARYPNASQREIADRQHVSTATIAVSLKKLEKGGYISRSADKQDNRFNQICLTPKGHAAVEKNKNIFSRVEEAQFRGFTDSEIDQFENFLDRIRLNLEYLMQENGGDCRNEKEPAYDSSGSKKTEEQEESSNEKI